MKIYIGHSSSMDFRGNLYEPLRNSKLSERHNLVFPHDGSDELFDSKSFLQDEADLMVAEVSQPSTGLGIELGWADSFGLPIICIHRDGETPSSSIKAVESETVEYKDNEEMLGC
ncbi:hypothetical protein [Candidatus Nanohalobium constans]|uniref:Nucleoside 2-deoxyribosyltransferase n=1 Tax=Candidatus Nanohalobium constans TaxID=2565781 RepID=A0A5Q0UFY9_9ARCH|nr:hypothetical protein [Candidatus Nanohalobium constans]QGA80311.1 hypothetical protein LC1Nh_0410 [Candidatus Nanohalobium constans]